MPNGKKLPPPSEILTEGAIKLPPPEQVLGVKKKVGTVEPSVTPEVSELETPSTQQKSDYFSQTLEQGKTTIQREQDIIPGKIVETGWGGITKKLPDKTISGIPLDEPEKINEDKEDFEFWNYLGRKLSIGIDKGAAAILRTPETIYDVTVNAFNLLLEGQDYLTGLVGLPGARKLATTEELGKMYGLENIPAKQLEAYAEFRSAIDEKYDKSITESIASGNYKDAAISTAGSIAESIPFTLSILAASAAGAGVPLLVAGVTTTMGAQRKQELLEREDLTETQKNTNALIYGLAESIDVLFGAGGTVGRSIRGVIKKKGIKDAIKYGVDVVDNLVKKSPYLMPFFESLQEGITQYIQNLADITVLGEEKSPMEGVSDAMIVGFAMGLGGGGIIQGVKTVKKISEKEVAPPTEPTGIPKIPKAKPVELEKSDYEFIEKAAAEPDYYNTLTNEFAQMVKEGTLTEKEGAQFKKTLDETIEIINKFPPDFDVKKKNKAYSLIKEKQELELENETLDEVFQEKNNERINVINEELKALQPEVAKEGVPEAKKPPEAPPVKKEVKPEEIKKEKIVAEEALQKDISEARGVEYKEVRPEEKPKPPEIEEKRQFAIDMVETGQVPVGVTGMEARVDYEMSSADRTKAVSDIKKGNLETAPAKKLIEKLEEFYEQGGLPIISGTGGKTIKGEHVPLKDQLELIEEAREEVRKETPPEDPKGKVRREIHKVKIPTGKAVKKGIEEVTGIKKEHAKKLMDVVSLYKQQLKDMTKGANLGKKETRKKAKELSTNLKDFISKEGNLKLLKELTGITSRTIIKKVSEIGDSPIRLQKTLEYIDKVLTQESFRQQEVEKASIIYKAIKLTSKKSLVKKQAGKEVALRPLRSRTDSADRIKKLRDINKQITEGNAEKSQEEINNIINELESRRETGKGEQNLTDKELDRIETLEFAEIWDMDKTQMETMLEKIKQIRENAKTKAEEEREKRHEAIKKRNQHSLKEIIPEGKKVLRGSMKNIINKKTHTIAEEGMIDFIWDSSFKSLLNKLSLFRTEKTKILEEWLTKTFYNDLVKKAEDAEIKSDREFKERKQEAIERILKAKGGKLKNKIIDGRIEEISDVSIINEKGEKENLYLSQLTALQKWMEYKDPTLTETFHKEMKDGGMGWTEGTVKQIEEYITPEWKEVGEWILKEYQTNYDKYNKAYRREYGVDMPKNPFYTPITREKGIFTDKPIDLLEKQTVQSIVSSGHLKSRQKNTNPLVYTDALDVFNSQTKKMTAFTNWSEPIRILNETFKDRDVKEAIAQFHGTEYNKVMDWFIKRFAGVEQTQQIVILDKAIRNLGKGILYLKSAIGIKQTISTIMYSADMPVGRLSFEIGKQLTNPSLFKNRLEAITSTEFWKNRGEQGFDLDIPPPEKKYDFRYRKTPFGKAMRQFNIKKEKLYNRLPLKTLNAIGAAPIKYGDLTPIVLGGSAYYGYKLNLYSKTMSPEKAKAKALEDFELLSEATQQSTRISNISYLRGSSSYGRALFMFTTGAGQIHRYVASAYREIRQGRNVADNTKKIIIAHGIMGAMFGIVGNGLKWDDEEMAWSFLLGNIRGMAFIGQMIAFIKDKIQKKPWGKSLRVSPVIENISKIADSSVLLGLELSNEFPDIIKALEYGQVLATEIATNRGIPAKGGVKLYKGISSVIRGDSENPIRETFGIENKWAKGVELWEIFYPRPTKHVKNESKSQYVNRRQEQDKKKYSTDEITKTEKEYDIYSTKDKRVIYFYESKNNNYQKATYLYEVFLKDGNETTYNKLKSLELISDDLVKKYNIIKATPDITTEELKIKQEEEKEESPFEEIKIKKLF